MESGFYVRGRWGNNDGGSEVRPQIGDDTTPFSSRLAVLTHDTAASADELPCEKSEEVSCQKERRTLFYITTYRGLVVSNSNQERSNPLP